MSLILDALRRPSHDRDASGAAKTARADAVLASLGYSRRQGRRAPPLKRLALFGAGAVVLGFVGVALLVTVLAPPPLPNQSTLAERSTGSPPPEPVPAAAPPAIEKPQLSQVSAPEPAPRAAASDEPPAAAPATPVREAAPSAPSAPVRNVTPDRSNGPSAAPPAPIRAQPVMPPPPPPAARSDSASIPEQPSAAPASPAPAQPPVNEFGRALFYQRFGDYAAARSLYSAVVTKNGPNSVVHNNEGVMFIDRGEPEGAILELKEALTLDPKYVKAQNNLGVAFLNAGRLEEASKALQMALAQEPRNVESIVNLALVHKAAGRPADARDLLHRAVAVEPRSAGAHYNLAVVADEAGESSVAAEHYRAFLRLGSGQYANLIAPVRARLGALER